MTKKALITGITGQCGSYLSNILISKGYEVHGINRRTSLPNTFRIEDLLDKITLHYGDLTDSIALNNIVQDVKPDEIYNLGAQSHVKVSFENPIYTADCVGLGTLRMLEAARILQEKSGKTVKFYQASSSEQFGKVVETPQRESTPFYPRSPYACAKTYAHYQCVNYREAYDMFVCCGLLFNNESPQRGETFVTRKITKAIPMILAGRQEKLFLGNLDARRDWGYSGDYVKAMWMMLQHNKPDDYVISTGQTHSVREFCDIAFSKVGLDYQKYVEVDPKFFRPTEVDLLIGDSSKARETLGWHPTISFAQLVEMMVIADVDDYEEKNSIFLNCFGEEADVFCDGVERV